MKFCFQKNNIAGMFQIIIKYACRVQKNALRNEIIDLCMVSNAHSWLYRGLQF